jgi:hypothetical protein
MSIIGILFVVNAGWFIFSVMLANCIPDNSSRWYKIVNICAFIQVIIFMCSVIIFCVLLTQAGNK